MSLSEKKIEELIHRDFACSCGHTHRADIEHVVIGEGAIGQLVPILLEQKLANGRVFDPASDTVFAVTDVHTHHCRSIRFPAAARSEYFVYRVFVPARKDAHHRRWGRRTARQPSV